MIAVWQLGPKMSLELLLTPELFRKNRKKSCNFLKFAKLLVLQTVSTVI